MPGYRGRLNDRCVTIAEVLRARRLLHRHDRQVARRPEPRRRALGARLRPLASTRPPAASTIPDSPRTELFLNGENVGRRGGELPDELVLHRPLDRLRHQVHRRGAGGEEAVLPLPGPQRAALPAAGAAGGHRQVPRQVQDRLGQAPRAAPREADRAGHRGQGVAALAAARRR